ncbi:hypothetical protein PG993_004491 [Apiospora rasikravindrae]|uniref:Uncharacterized protein n=1 Tax=Apiospora rasikravindrae TaxID=990691 RepID=A0ABR1TDH4_9PEZI
MPQGPRRQPRPARMTPSSPPTGDSIDMNTGSRSPSTPSSISFHNPAYSTAPSTPTATSTALTPTTSRRMNSRAEPSSRSPLFRAGDLYQIQSDEAVVQCRTWDEYLPSLGWGDCIFGSLRGTTAERYSTPTANTARRDRNRELREIQTHYLVNHARAVHSKCDTCGPDKISKTCPRKGDATMVQHGCNEFDYYFQLYRLEAPSKAAVQADWSRARIQGNIELKVVKRLNEMYPYMSYQPGEYLLQLVSMSEATDEQRAIGTRVEVQNEGYGMDFEDHILVPDGTVPFKLEEDLERFNDICPNILRMVVAILGFKPGATDLVPKTLRALFEPSELPHRQWDDLVAAWDLKFQKVSHIPKAIQSSVAGARDKFSEAAWLIRRLQGEQELEGYLERELLFETLEKLLCRVTKMEFDELVDQHLKRLGTEAWSCLENGDDDKVLVYAAGSFPKDFKDIHSYYTTNSGFPQPAPFDVERRETFRLAALRIIDDEETTKAVLSLCRRDLAEQGRFLDEDHGDSNTTAPAEDEDPQPSTTEQPEIAPKKRGRPPKKEGDPKGPYRKRKKTEDPANNSQQPPTAS